MYFNIMSVKAYIYVPSLFYHNTALHCFPLARPLRKPSNNSIIFVYLSLPPVAHLSDALRRCLAVTGDSARIQNETTESSAWFFNMLGI